MKVFQQHPNGVLQLLSASSSTLTFSGTLTHSAKTFLSLDFQWIFFFKPEWEILIPKSSSSPQLSLGCHWQRRSPEKRLLQWADQWRGRREFLYSPFGGGGEVGNEKTTANDGARRDHHQHKQLFLRFSSHADSVIYLFITNMPPSSVGSRSRIAAELVPAAAASSESPSPSTSRPISPYIHISHSINLW